MRRVLLALLVLAVAGGAIFFVLTMPRTIPASALPAHEPNVKNGEYMFIVGGCAECHAEPLKKCNSAKTKDKTALTGGRCLNTPFGVFNVPNISPDKESGIGTWSTIDFVNAMKMGIAPGGEHLYPAFPYNSYQRMTYEDLIDLKAYLDTLPAVKHKTPPHELAFPYNIRRGLGLWQLLYVDGKTFTPDTKATDELNRGAYLVEGPGHCGECHRGAKHRNDQQQVIIVQRDKRLAAMESLSRRQALVGSSVIETAFQFGKVSKLLLHASYLDLRGARMTLLLRSSLSNMLPIAEHQQH